MEIFLKSLIIASLLIVSVDLIAQEKAPVPKLKSVVVQEEDFAKSGGVKRPELETYYDQAGNLIEERQYKDGRFDSHEKNEYDKEGNKIKVTELDENGKVLKYTVYRYEKGLKTEKTVFGANQKMKSRKTYQYKFY
jgi:hypothetical protein